MTNSTNKVFVNIQALRAIAALMVVFGHSLVPKEFPLIEGALTIFHSFAYAGVDLFFVLSGFIISVAATREHGGAFFLRGRRAMFFLLKRFVRIFPVYWIVLGISAIASHWHVLAPAGFAHVSLPVIFLLTQANWLVQQAWTLSFELYFYAVVSLVLLIAPQRYFTCMALLMAIQAAIVFTATNPDSQMWTNALILEFGMGCFVAFLMQKQRRISPVLLLVAGLVFFLRGAVLTSEMIASQHMQLHSLERMMTFGVGAMLILTAALKFETGKQFIAGPRMQFLGDASYSIYLLHMTMLVVIAAFFKSTMFAGVLPKYAEVLITVALSVLSCIVFYHWVEQPMLAWLKSRIDSLQRTDRFTVKKTPDQMGRASSKNTAVP